MIASLLKYAPVQVFSALSVFALIAVQTRFLSPEHYGVLAVAMVVLELVRAFSAQWLNTSMLRLYPGYSDRSKSNSFKAFHCWSSSDLCLALLLLPRLYLFISN